MDFKTFFHQVNLSLNSMSMNFLNYVSIYYNSRLFRMEVAKAFLLKGQVAHF